MIDNKRIGMSLSGGGFRAVAYHLGALKKLRQMGILDKIDVISTVSGGSIVGACYGLHGEDFEKFESILKAGVKNDIINHIIATPRFLILVVVVVQIFMSSLYFLFTSQDWITLVIIFGLFVALFRYQFKLLPVSNMIAKFYDKYFFEGKVITDLNPSPWIAMNATNLETGRPFTFSQVKMEDSTYEYPADDGGPILFRNQNYPISKAVAASAGVPFAFTPVMIHPRYFEKPSDVKRARPVLVDGGVYDNQGIHKITQKKSAYNCDIIITSDAENLFREVSVYRNLIQVLVRTSEIFMNRIKDFQMIQNVFDNYRMDKREVAYQVMGWDPDYCMRMFMYGLKNGEIMPWVAAAHGITQDEMLDCDWDEIRSRVEENIGYGEILERAPSQEEINICHNVKVNIKSLKNEEIEALMKQAACLTEIQVKLYCPTLWLND
jgi:NTE family protein